MSKLRNSAKSMAVFGMVTQATFFVVQVLLMVSHGVKPSNIACATVCLCGFILFAACYLLFRRRDNGWE